MWQEAAKRPPSVLGAACMEELRKLSLKAASESAAGDKEVKGMGRRQRSKTQTKSRLWQGGMRVERYLGLGRQDLPGEPRPSQMRE